jgi:hypothetical protein
LLPFFLLVPSFRAQNSFQTNFLKKKQERKPKRSTQKKRKKERRETADAKKTKKKESKRRNRTDLPFPSLLFFPDPINLTCKKLSRPIYFLYLHFHHIQFNKTKQNKPFFILASKQAPPMENTLVSFFCLHAHTNKSNKEKPTKKSKKKKQKKTKKTKKTKAHQIEKEKKVTPTQIFKIQFLHTPNWKHLHLHMYTCTHTKENKRKTKKKKKKERRETAAAKKNKKKRKKESKRRNPTDLLFPPTPFLSFPSLPGPKLRNLQKTISITLLGWWLYQGRYLHSHHILFNKTKQNKPFFILKNKQASKQASNKANNKANTPPLLWKTLLSRFFYMTLLAFYKQQSNKPRTKKQKQKDTKSKIKKKIPPTKFLKSNFCTLQIGNTPNNQSLHSPKITASQKKNKRKTIIQKKQKKTKKTKKKQRAQNEFVLVSFEAGTPFFHKTKIAPPLSPSTETPSLTFSALNKQSIKQSIKHKKKERRETAVAKKTKKKESKRRNRTDLLFPSLPFPDPIDVTCKKLSRPVYFVGDIKDGIYISITYNSIEQNKTKQNKPFFLLGSKQARNKVLWKPLLSLFFFFTCTHTLSAFAKHQSNKPTNQEKTKKSKKNKTKKKQRRRKNNFSLRQKSCNTKHKTKNTKQKQNTQRKQTIDQHFLRTFSPHLHKHTKNKSKKKKKRKPTK